jgi:DNA replication and repair protein RecF
MMLRELKLVNFRNYHKAEIKFHHGTNVFYGKNGQGKTNLLESIYYLALTKSFRTSNDHNLILNNQNYFRLQGEFSNVQELLFDCSLAYALSDGKRLNYKGQRVQRFSEYIGNIPIVLLAPSDLEISLGGPFRRRQFLDVMLSQADKLYLDHLIKYRRALKQRNVLLQQEKVDEALMSAWGESIVENGSVLIEKRIAAIEILDEMVKRTYKQISNSEDKVKILYQSTVSFRDTNEIVINFINQLNEVYSKDKRQESSSIGPHRDDVLFLINGKPLRILGSQGEHKSFIVAIKMAEFEYLQKVQNEPPLLLFDDIFGELDSSRITSLISSLSQIGQVFITTTSRDFFEKVNSWDKKTFFYEIIKGMVNSRN